MAKYFLGSVGEAEAYRVTTSFTGETSMDLVLSCSTLTDSAVNVSINQEQIVDSYNGAPVGVFYHSPSVNITLSDIKWNDKFLEVVLGQKFNQLCDEGNVEYIIITATAVVNPAEDGEGGIVILSNLSPVPTYPVPLNFPTMDGTSDTYVILGKLKDEDTWHTFDYDATNHVIGLTADNKGELLAGGEYCFKYPIASMQSKTLNITTRIMPEELFLRITTPIFMAEDCSVNGSYVGNDYDFISTGQQVGHIMYEVPRWALNGDASFNFSMSSHVGMQLSGIVLESVEDGEEPVFMRFHEYIKTRAWYENLVDIVWDKTMDDDQVENVYGLYSDGTYKLLTSNRNNIRLAFQIDGDSTTTANNTAANDQRVVHEGDTDVCYNISGKFTSTISANRITIYPAMMYYDEEGHASFLVFNNITN